MTNVKFPRKEFEKHIKLTKEVEEKISLFGTPLEKIDNEEIEIEVFPNRPDLISLHGFMRGFKTFLGNGSGLKKYDIKNPEKDFSVKVFPSVNKVRPFTVCAIVKGFNFDDEKIKEIIELQEKLHFTIGRNRKKVAIGIYPLGKIKLPIKYRALAKDKIKFVPLDAEKEMSGSEILRKHPKGKDYAHLLKDEERYPIFSDAGSSILSMPPIINSKETGKIDEKTKDVFVECSGSDFNTLSKTLNIVVTTLAEMGGQIYQVNLDYMGKKITTPDLTPDKMKISVDNANKVLGLKLKEKNLRGLLHRMGYDYKEGVVHVPPWRTDVLHEVDIIEDIAIAYGYDKLIPEIPNVSTIGEESTESKTMRKLAELFVGLGMLEIQTYHLVRKEDFDIVKAGEKIEVEDSRTDYRFLRTNLINNVLNVLSQNKDKDYPQKVFEVGTVFSRDNSGESETGIKETNNLIAAISPGNFTEIKQIVNYLFASFEIEFKLKEDVNSCLIDGRTAAIFLGDKKIGYFGEVHPRTLKAAGIKMPVAVLEMNSDIFIN
ncbi:phenylalanine--tRNA ligase subunit beta [Candidatus Pacearchaeota archaeon]|nr:phenylalanine--tRNA ligase subunit beta [Candidatus Pacearchaeota archaeon]